MPGMAIRKWREKLAESAGIRAIVIVATGRHNSSVRLATEVSAPTRDP